MKVRPHSAGSLRSTSSERRSPSQPTKKRRNSAWGGGGDRRCQPPPPPPRPASQSDSGWESEGMSEFEGKLLSEWNSLLSVGGESVASGCSVRSASSAGLGQPTLVVVGGDQTAAAAAAAVGGSAGEALTTKMGSRPPSGR